MAFNSLNVQQAELNRKILEDLQIKKQLIQKGVVNPVSTTIPSIPFTQINQLGNQSIENNIPVNSPARISWSLANNQSFGFFIPQDSLFGNNILPVLPRFENNQK